MRTLCTLVAVAVISACTLQTPIWHGDLADNLCVEGPAQYTYEGVTYDYYLHLLEYPEADVFCTEAVGDPSQACIKNNYDIYVNEGRLCKVRLAHELNHLVGNHWVDRPPQRGH